MHNASRNLGWNSVRCKWIAAAGLIPAGNQPRHQKSETEEPGGKGWWSVQQCDDASRQGVASHGRD